MSDLEEGSRSEEYRRWKEETLAKQTSHKEAQQRTGLWQQFKEVEPKSLEKNDYTVEVAPGCRVVSEGGIEAVWCCPKFRGMYRVW